MGIMCFRDGRFVDGFGEDSSAALFTEMSEVDG